MDKLPKLKAQSDAAVPVHWRAVADDGTWNYTIKLDGENVASGYLIGKGLPVVDRVVALLPDLLIEQQHASSLEISIDCVPF